jgi:hypothetical protein
MINKALLAGTLAAGLIVPAQAKAGLILPPKPAIIKPENIEFSKHMLAMPFTMGMLPRKDGGTPSYINSSSGGYSTSLETISWSHTTTSLTTCLVVGQTVNKSGAAVGTSTVTFNGVALTQFVTASAVGGNQGTRLFYLLNPPIGTFTLSVQISGTVDRHHTAQAVNLGGVSAVGGTATASDDDIASGVDLTTTLTAVSSQALLIGQVYGKNKSGGGIPTLVANAPSSTTQAVTNSGTANSLGVRVSMYYTPLVGPGSVSLNFDCSSSATTPLMYAFGEFRA